MEALQLRASVENGSFTGLEEAGDTEPVRLPITRGNDRLRHRPAHGLGLGHPKTVCAIGFQSVMTPFESIVMTASSAVSKMLLSRRRYSSCAAWAAFRSAAARTSRSITGRNREIG